MANPVTKVTKVPAYDEFFEELLSALWQLSRNKITKFKCNSRLFTQARTPAAEEKVYKIYIDWSENTRLCEAGEEVQWRQYFNTRYTCMMQRQRNLFCKFKQCHNTAAVWASVNSILNLTF